MPSLSANSLEEDEEDTLPLAGNASFGLFGLNINLLRPRYQCHSCEQPDCSEPSICHDAFQVIHSFIDFQYNFFNSLEYLQCWKSRVRDASGYESVSKGCTTNLDQVILYCNTKSFDGNGENDLQNSLYSMECCEGDLCNNGTFPPLPTRTYEGSNLSASI